LAEADNKKTLKKRNSFLKEFKDFILRGNVVDMAVGIVIGVAFGTVINSAVNDMIMPPIGLLLGKVNFANLFVVLRNGTTPPPYSTVAVANEAGAVTLNYGIFINAIISFIIIALVVYSIIKMMNRFNKKEEAKSPELKECPYCFSLINIKATKCPYCTSDLQ
jgi:large conductance mechanosensitive channel